MQVPLEKKREKKQSKRSEGENKRWKIPPLKTIVRSKQTLQNSNAHQRVVAKTIGDHGTNECQKQNPPKHGRNNAISRTAPEKAQAAAFVHPRKRRNKGATIANQSQRATS